MNGSLTEVSFSFILFFIQIIIRKYLGESIDKLEAAINGNYMVINDLVRVLNDGAFCKQVVDSAIDRCKKLLLFSLVTLIWLIR